MLLDNKNKHRMYPTKSETEGAISSLDNLTVMCSSDPTKSETEGAISSLDNLTVMCSSDPTKSETEGAISSLDNLTVMCSSEDITNDVRNISCIEHTDFKTSTFLKRKPGITNK